MTESDLRTLFTSELHVDFASFTFCNTVDARYNDHPLQRPSHYNDPIDKSQVIPNLNNVIFTSNIKTFWFIQSNITPGFHLYFEDQNVFLSVYGQILEKFLCTELFINYYQYISVDFFPLSINFDEHEHQSHLLLE